MKVLNYEGLQLYHELASEEFVNQSELQEIQADITNLKDGKVDKDGNKVLSTNDYTTSEKNKLAGIAEGAEVNQNAFSNITIGSTTISADNKTDTLTIVAGKNITLTPDSTNDKITIAAEGSTYSEATTSTAGLMSAGDKAKLDNAVDKLSNIEAGANKYSHPTHTSKTSGLYKITVDGLGHVSSATAVSKADITGLGIPAQDTTYSVATTAANGLMSATDKTNLDNALDKLSGIAAGANNYSLPTASSTLGGVKTTSTVTSTSGLTACPIISGVVYYKDTDTNTHYTTRLYAGASGTAANAAATDPYLKVTDDNTYRNQIQFKGSGATTVSSDANGVITISSTDTNTNTDTKVTQGRSTSSSYRPLLMHNTYGDYGTDVGQVTNTVYYNETIAAKASTGELRATSFSGSGADLTSLNASNISSGTIAAARLPAATSSAYGAVKIGYTQSGKNYPVQLSNGQMYVNVPWTDTNTTYTLSSFGITATSTELNYCDGVTSNIQTQINNCFAANISRTANYVLAAPNGSNGNASFRKLVAADIPNLDVSKLTAGTLGTARGGTGITSNPSMLVNLGSTSAASVFAASPRPGITGTLGIGNGGTGATSKSGARTNLGITSGTSLPSSASAGDIFFLYS